MVGVCSHYSIHTDMKDKIQPANAAGVLPPVLNVISTIRNGSMINDNGPKRIWQDSTCSNLSSRAISKPSVKEKPKMDF